MKQLHTLDTIATAAAVAPTAPAQAAPDPKLFAAQWVAPAAASQRPTAARGWACGRVRSRAPRKFARPIRCSRGLGDGLRVLLAASPSGPLTLRLRDDAASDAHSDRPGAARQRGEGSWLAQSGTAVDTSARTSTIAIPPALAVRQNASGSTAGQATAGAAEGEFWTSLPCPRRLASDLVRLSR